MVVRPLHEILCGPAHTNPRNMIDLSAEDDMSLMLPLYDENFREVMLEV